MIPMLGFARWRTPDPLRSKHCFSRSHMSKIIFVMSNRIFKMIILAMTCCGIIFMKGVCLVVGNDDDLIIIWCIIDDHHQIMMMINMIRNMIMSITWRGIVFMGGVRPVLADELEHWQAVLIARRCPRN